MAIVLRLAVASFCLCRCTRKEAQGRWDWNQSKKAWTVRINNVLMHCCPNPATAKAQDGAPAKPLPTHRYPSTATPSFFFEASGAADGSKEAATTARIRTEDDGVYVHYLFP